MVKAAVEVSLKSMPKGKNVSSRSDKSQTPSSSKQKGKQKVQVKAPPAKKTLVTTSANPSAAMSTPKRSNQAKSAPPEISSSLAKKPTKVLKSIKESMVKLPFPKQNPQQMQTGNHPTNYTSTKNTMFIHIKMLWGLLKADSVPEPPSLRNLKEFYSHFSNEQHIKKAAQMSSPAIINPQEVELLKDACAGRI
ncbi:hypothetical protein PCANC_15370 [Puccinia coronata f. sp. avenae]|uniref:Uncharacterized protein n=1 Tax=Puccinia coronata f. sp. avenae TaxID=200324 RepID=A0A2N5SS35_9BASI|nr:hypothetical protein PCANC_15370 [Puccinia coronata f. sp. avenae]